MSASDCISNNENDKSYKVLALYRFTTTPLQLSTMQTLKDEIESKLRSVKARGTIILASEGINGTICYPNHNCKNDGKTHENKDQVLEYLENNPYFKGIRTRASYTDTAIFHRLKVKVKEMIVTMADGVENKHDTQINLDKKSNDNTDEENNRKDTGVEGCIDNGTIANPNEIVGTYVKPGEEWDNLLLDPDVVVIDTRNKYEVEIGTFENAISPETDNFNQFPEWLRRFALSCQKVGGDNDTSIADIEGQPCEGQTTKPTEHEQQQKPLQCVINRKISNTNNDSPCSGENTYKTNANANARSKKPVPITSMPIVNKKPKAVAMFCTGGIRCEKATSYALSSKLFPPEVPVYHLEGGVLAYLDSHPDGGESSKWKGECFVFDQRVALTHGLQPSEAYNSCHACRRPVHQQDKIGEDYVRGVFCEKCKGEVTERQKKRFEERERQMKLAEERGDKHIHDPKEIFS